MTAPTSTSDTGSNSRLRLHAKGTRPGESPFSSQLASQFPAAGLLLRVRPGGGFHVKRLIASLLAALFLLVLTTANSQEQAQKPQKEGEPKQQLPAKKPKKKAEEVKV